MKQVGTQNKIRQSEIVKDQNKTSRLLLIYLSIYLSILYTYLLFQ